MSNAAESHRIAAAAATRLVKECHAAGFDWPEIAVSCETTVAIVVAAVAKMVAPHDPSGRPDPARVAQELVETITEGAHLRVQKLLRGEPL